MQHGSQDHDQPQEPERQFRLGHCGRRQTAALIRGKRMCPDCPDSTHHVAEAPDKQPLFPSDSSGDGHPDTVVCRRSGNQHGGIRTDIRLEGVHKSHQGSRVKERPAIQEAVQADSRNSRNDRVGQCAGISEGTQI